MSNPSARRRAARRNLRWLSLFAFALPAVVQAQSVRSVDVSADVTSGDGAALVRVIIDFVPDTSGLRVELLGFDGATADGFRAGGPDGPELRFTERSGSRAWIVIPRDAFASVGLTRGDAMTDAWRITASYAVRDAVVHDGALVRVRVPVLTVALPPARDAGNVFRVVLRTPPDWSPTESFPTGIVARGTGEYGVELAVPPSVISLRARTDGTWRPGVPLVLDVLAGAILLVFVVVGWRHLRAAASADDSPEQALASNTGRNT